MGVHIWAGRELLKGAMFILLYREDRRPRQEEAAYLQRTKVRFNTRLDNGFHGFAGYNEFDVMLVTSCAKSKRRV